MPNLHAANITFNTLKIVAGRALKLPSVCDLIAMHFATYWLG